MALSGCRRLISELGIFLSIVFSATLILDNQFTGIDQKKLKKKRLKKMLVLRLLRPGNYRPNRSTQQLPGLPVDIDLVYHQQDNGNRGCRNQG